MSAAADLAERLARDAQSVCRHYLPAGRREGRYWTVGDVHGSPGRSLHVRLFANGRGPAGKWVDEATGEHGDLLDLIAANQSLTSLKDTLEEARRFLSLPQPERRDELRTPAPTGSPEAARRLWAISKPIGGTVAETYLVSRGITVAPGHAWLSFHPRCWYRPNEDDRPDCRDRWPAVIAAVTDGHGAVTGVQRTWLDHTGAKAPIATPRRAMGSLLGNAVRFGQANDVLIVGEGIETMLSLRTVLPDLPVAACLSANHLAAFRWPETLRRLYIAREADRSSAWATESLIRRATEGGLEAVPLDSARGDFNDDLRQLGPEALRTGVLAQMRTGDVGRFGAQ